MTEENVKNKHEKDLKILKAFRLMDDKFMSKVFEDKKSVQLLLQIILKRDDLTVQNVNCQYDIKNLQGRSTRLDILATDPDGKMYNIEIQRSNKGASAKRARYNSSLIDANITEPGEEYDELMETYVIFITENDVLKESLPIYHIDRVIRETGKPFEDGSHIVYVNSKIQDATALGRLMHDFYCTSADKMHYKVLADRVRYFKEDEKGAIAVCKELEELRTEEHAEGHAEGLAEGLEKGEINGTLKTLAGLVNDKILSVTEAAKRAGVTEEEIRKML